MNPEQSVSLKTSIQDLDSALQQPTGDDRFQRVLKVIPQSQWTAVEQEAFMRALVGPMTPKAQASRQLNSGILKTVDHRRKY
jgi:hypothetical protein